MPETIKAAHDLTEAMNRRSHIQFWANILRTVLVALALVVAIALLINVVNGRGENARRSRERKDQIDKLSVIAARIKDATDPSGCVNQRGKKDQAAAIAQILNDNRGIHNKPTIPVPTPDTTPCPGEKDGPTIIVPAEPTSTTRTTRRANQRRVPTTRTTTTMQAARTSQPPRTTTTGCTAPVSELCGVSP